MLIKLPTDDDVRQHVKRILAFRCESLHAFSVRHGFNAPQIAAWYTRVRGPDRTMLYTSMVDLVNALIADGAPVFNPNALDDKEKASAETNALSPQHSPILTDMAPADIDAWTASLKATG